MGDSPTVSLKLEAKFDRDIPARSASFCTVQECAGSSCIELRERQTVLVRSMGTVLELKIANSRVVLRVVTSLLAERESMATILVNNVV